jgi:hypothetical protein
VEPVEDEGVRVSIATTVSGPLLEFLACHRCQDSTSHFSSWELKARHVFSSKIQNSFPKSSVVDSRRSREGSVCRQSLARACQRARVNKVLKLVYYKAPEEGH